MSSDHEYLKGLASEISFLRKLVFFQRAQIEALQHFAAAHIGDLSKVDRDSAMEQLQKITRQRYDDIILKLGDTHPEIADDADVRKGVKPEDQDKWFFP